MGFFTGNTSIRSNEQINKPTAHKVINKEGTYDVANIGTITVKMNNKVLIPTKTVIPRAITSSFDIDAHRKFLSCEKGLFLYDSALNDIIKITDQANINIYIELPDNVFCFGCTNSSFGMLYDITQNQIIYKSNNLSINTYINKANIYILFKTEAKADASRNLLIYLQNTKEYYFMDIHSIISKGTIWDIVFLDNNIIEIVCGSGIFYYSLTSNSIIEQYLIKDFVGYSSSPSYTVAYSGTNKIVFASVSSKFGLIEFDKTLKSFSKLTELEISYYFRGERYNPGINYNTLYKEDCIAVHSNNAGDDPTKYVWHYTKGLIPLPENITSINGVNKISTTQYLICGCPSAILDISDNSITLLNKNNLVPIMKISDTEIIFCPGAINSYGFYLYNTNLSSIEQLHSKGLLIDILYRIPNNEIVMNSTDSTFSQGLFVLNTLNKTVEHYGVGASNLDIISNHPEGYLLSSSTHPTVILYNPSKKTAEVYGVYMEVE